MLKISKNAALTDIVSVSNPIKTQHPTTGSTQTVQLWLFNDDATKRYESINLDPTDASGSDESGWVALAPDNAGAAGTYLSGGAALSMANISDLNVGKPFWAKITSPSVADSQNKTDLNITINYTEFAV